ncbi:MAG: CotH kinase family protein [Cytophagales bacterium]
MQKTFYIFFLLFFTSCNNEENESIAVDVNFQESNLPIVMIDTYGEDILDEPRIDAYMGVINNTNGINNIGDNFNDYDGKITIEKRGNSSQDQEKPPYRFETVDNNAENNNVQLLGFPEENDWILYAPWSDKSLLRNVLIYSLSNEMGRYAPRSKFVELYINDEYRGVYVLMEKIKRDKNRVEISALNPNENSGDNVTGGYILKFDWAETGDNNGGFYSLIDGMRYNYHYPKADEISTQQKDYIQTFINSYENVMNGNNYNTENGYSKFIDVESFIDFIILQEISRNVDAYGLSTYVYKDKESINNKLTAGPIWDFNHGFGNCDYYEAWETDGWNISYIYDDMDQRAFWWLKLWDEENFKGMVKDRYNELRLSVLSTNNVNSKIDEYVSTLGNSVNRNFTKWPILGEYIWPNYQVFDTHQEEIVYLKSWINNRLTWMDSELN